MFWQSPRSDAEAAFYFSGVTYTTLGDGDVVLGQPWRMLGPVESLMGVLMCGLSTGYFFVVVSRIHQTRHRNPPLFPELMNRWLPRGQLSVAAAIEGLPNVFERPNRASRDRWLRSSFPQLAQQFLPIARAVELRRPPRGR